MSKIKKILICFIIIIVIFEYNVFARYNYKFELSAFHLERDDSEITYSIRKSIEQYTNSDVELVIEVNKEIEEVEGFNLSESKKKLTATFSDNKNGTLLLKDRSGNKKEVNYEINNIDKIPPNIEGIENGRTYNQNLTPTYTDNIGIKSINAEKYDYSLNFTCHADFHDSDSYKGIDVSKSTIYVSISSKPRNTKKFLYYLDGVLKCESSEEEYTYTNLTPYTTYNIRIDAIDSNGQVLLSSSRYISTMRFASVETNKTDSTFTMTLYDLDPSVIRAVTTKFCDTDRGRIIYETANVEADGSMTSTLVATNLTNTVENAFYFLQFHLKDGSDRTLEIVTCNILFGANYVKPISKIDPYNLTQNGFYEITVTDLAGNITKKEFSIQK